MDAPIDYKYEFEEDDLVIFSPTLPYNKPHDQNKAKPLSLVLSTIELTDNTKRFFEGIPPQKKNIISGKLKVIGKGKIFEY